MTPVVGGETDAARVQQIADRVVQGVAELPDRTSPDDWPEAMLVTAEELRALVSEAAADLLASSAREIERMTNDDQSRQRTPDVPGATGSPRSPQPEGSDRESCGHYISELPCVRPKGHTGNCSGYCCAEDE
jgi:hypothetical protein